MKNLPFLRELCLIIAVSAFRIEIFAQQSGKLDSTFGNYGIVTTDFGGIDQPRAVAIQSDGKIIVAGTTSVGFTLARYNTNGTLDSIFDTNGKLTNSAATSVVIQSNGKIVLAGFSNNGIQDEFALVRFNANGTLDTTFGGDGIINTSFGIYSAISNSLAIQLDGKIVAAGYSVRDSNYVFALARYNIDGTIDNSFGSGGKVTTYFGGYWDQANAIAIQPDGKIVVTGFSDDLGSNHFFALARYNVDGTLDISFGTGGKLITDITPEFDEANSVVLQSDGKIVIAGFAASQFALARYNSEGILDNSFGTEGKVVTRIGNSCKAYFLILQADEKIIAGGFSIDIIPHFTLALYNSGGCLDSTFGLNGIVTTSIGNYGDEAYSGILQPDGKMVVAGYSHSHLYNDDFALARYLPNLEVGVIDFLGTDNQELIYPNPIQQNAMLNYVLNDDTEISIYLYDIEGKRLKTFVANEIQTVGRHQQTITLPHELPSGSYFIFISTPKGRSGIKIVH